MPLNSNEQRILEDDLRADLKKSLELHGFIVNNQERLNLEEKTKESFRRIQIEAKKEIMKKNSPFLRSNVDLIKKYSIDGKDLDPSNIQLELRQVNSGTDEEIIFRWWNLSWWSMPYQKPYGRQMRFIMWDKYHDVPFGLISLQSPILVQSVRDKYLEIPREELDYWINRSMYAQRIGALPPYNHLIGGKMVALSLVSNEIRDAYHEKYKSKKTIMSGREIDSELLFITTTSAFGKSSMYSRLRYNNYQIAEKLGYTEGFGSFQISDEIYNRLISYLSELGEDTKRGYGAGPSRKLRLITLACRKLGLANYSYHGIRREYYLFSLVKNLKDVIKNDEPPEWRNYTLEELSDYWERRWLTNRAATDKFWNVFNSDEYIDNVIYSLSEHEKNMEKNF